MSGEPQWGCMSRVQEQQGVDGDDWEQMGHNSREAKEEDGVSEGGRGVVTGPGATAGDDNTGGS